MHRAELQRVRCIAFEGACYSDHIHPFVGLPDRVNSSRWFTPREAEVMQLVVKGRLNKQIAHTLGISEKRVKAHRVCVMRKLEARSLAGLNRVSGLAADAT